ncbi:GNAT family N-acetyltransferase [Malaciobacter mytili]|uniref:GNAT family N-acetyltransferase n=1 Tax=Malaciobacter mytili TaxID=603050 RepID=UPI00100A9A89|nr:GNAT family N-acetyltransferase [Malaciobacter mytili]RXI47062.1 GNAT family N-acetyltransferase [Malaciobacter mytili]
MKIKLITTKQELEKAFEIRKKVFVEEQKVSMKEEFDKYETSCEHILAFIDNLAIATARLRVVDNIAKLERICVLPLYRKDGIGKKLIYALEEIALEKQLKKAKLHAQTNAQSFYEKLGYKAEGKVFFEAGIKHILMIKELKSEKI